MDKLPRISESEWEIMKILWKKSPLTAAAIINGLRKKTDWKPKTVKSLISRLIKKNAIGFDSNGRSYQYYPLVSRADCRMAETASFLDRVFDGEFNALFSTLVKGKKLNRKQIDELKEILSAGSENKETP